MKFKFVMLSMIGISMSGCAAFGLNSPGSKSEDCKVDCTALCESEGRKFAVDNVIVTAKWNDAVDPVIAPCWCFATAEDIKRAEETQKAAEEKKAEAQNPGNAVPQANPAK